MLTIISVLLRSRISMNNTERMDVYVNAGAYRVRVNHTYMM